MVDNLMTLGFLVLLQAVLGFDNLLYISLESKRAPVDKRTFVRRLGIGLAVALRIGLLFVLIKLIELVQEPFFRLELTGWLEGAFNLHSVIVLAGGVFIIYTALKEIWHMVSIEEITAERKEAKPGPTGLIIAMIVVMNVVFSFDSILSAMALTKVFWVMAAAIVIGGVLMIWLADRVATFLQRNRMYEVLGLFILLIVGVMLVTEGGELGHLKLWGSEVHAMGKATFYFVIVVLILVDLVQSRYKKKLLSERAAASKDQATKTPAGAA